MSCVIVKIFKIKNASAYKYIYNVSYIFVRIFKIKNTSANKYIASDSSSRFVLLSPTMRGLTM